MSVDLELQRDLMAALGAAGLLGEHYNRVTRVVLVLDLNEVPRLTVSRVLTDRDMTLLTGAIAEQEKIRQQRPAQTGTSQQPPIEGAPWLWGTAMGSGFSHLWSYEQSREAWHPMCMPDEWVDHVKTAFGKPVGPVCPLCNLHDPTGQLHDAQEVGK